MEELNRLIIKIPNRYGDTSFMWFVQEDEEQWSLISIGQEYELYREIGKRCALAEIGNLLLPPLGRVTMEEYLAICERAVINSEETIKLYDLFKIEVKFCLKDFDSYGLKRVKEMIETFSFQEMTPDVFYAINPDPSVFSIIGIRPAQLQASYIGPVIQQDVLNEKQQTLF